jgi:hypothetical protein
MITLGVADLLVVLLFVVTVVVTTKEKMFGFFYVAVFVFVILLAERLAPGALTQVSNAIQSVNKLNDLAPHLTINPIVTFK